ncbi:anthranilate synthase component I family protein [Pseudomonas sp. T1.Ur]|uniref:anthranilate synthase component I family protein n=1 Tax=Pseudomonas sp. T1.Ur TaxID=2928704 RepID=UPI00201DF9CC|nr:anthranilate synthase component I family protein [Pseudomonas sp. T1.Ur]MCL6703852.1 anthranilate synthase component I family protein [Pseudomonas sp. T1.Ur]
MVLTVNKNLIGVNVLRREERRPTDALGIYANALEQLGRESVFILESLSGPSRDRRATIIGLEPLFEVRINEGQAQLRGCAPLCEHLSASLRQAGMQVDQEHKIHLPDSEAAWNLLRAIQATFQPASNAPSSLAFFGYFAYDCVRLIERLPDLAKQTYDYPLIALSVYQTLVYLHSNGIVETLINNHDLWSPRTLEDYPFLSTTPAAEALAPQPYPEAFEEERTVTPEQFVERVEVAMEHIRAGDVYQIQLGHEIRIRSQVSPFDVYQNLRLRNPSPYMYLAHVGGIDLIGASPELFVRIKDDLIEMRPIAGTVGKKPGVDPTQLVLELTRSEKERAEHLMLIDLCRNDIGRVCQAGSLEVDEFMLVEEYSHLYHMVSNVRGLLRPDLDAYDVIKASFPAGTMSGAPKVRAMELIEGMESNRRGIYAGALGLVGFDGSVNTALCIRSTVFDEGTYHLRASAGVVADSVPELEWKETLYKMGSVYRAVTGQEITL